MNFKVGIVAFGLLAVCAVLVLELRGPWPLRGSSATRRPVAFAPPAALDIVSPPSRTTATVSQVAPAGKPAFTKRAPETTRLQTTLLAKVTRYLSPRAIKLRGRSFSPLKGAVAILIDKVPRGAKEIARENGYAIVENRSGDPLPEGARLALYDANNDNLIVATGMIRIKLHPEHDGNNIERESGLSLAHSFPHLRTYFLQTPATTIDQLNSYLASARLLPGVLDAKLDLIETRNTPQ